MLDLAAYFARIGLALDSPAPTLETLNAIARAHVQTIPFENLDVLRGKPIELELPALEKKLVHDRRGGYCFEQNSFLLQVLTQLGFKAHLVAGRVRYQRPRDYTPPRTHVFARVEIDGVSWLADVGVGGISPTSAIRLFSDEEQRTPHDVRRIERSEHFFHHHVRLGGEWHEVCEFTLEENHPIDREVANWYTSTHPRSPFKSRLMVARALPEGGRVTVMNQEFTRRAPGGTASTRVMQTKGELLEVLEEHFAIVLPGDVELVCPELRFAE